MIPILALLAALSAQADVQRAFVLPIPLDQAVAVLKASRDQIAIAAGWRVVGRTPDALSPKTKGTVRLSRANARGRVEADVTLREWWWQGLDTAGNPMAVYTSQLGRVNVGPVQALSVTIEVRMVEGGTWVHIHVRTAVNGGRKAEDRLRPEVEAGVDRVQAWIEGSAR